MTEGQTAAFQRGFRDGLTYGLLTGAGVVVIVLPLLLLWL